MFKLASAVLLFAFVALTLAEPRLQQQQQLRSAAGNGASVSSKHPFLFLSVPRGRAGAVANNAVQGLQVVEVENDEDDDEAQFDDEDDEMERNASMVDYDDDEASREDDDDYDSDAGVSDEDNGVELVNVRERIRGQSAGQHNLQLVMKNAKSTHMMVSREHAGAIMVPDGVIEIEGQSVVDEKTGKTALLVPREALDAIPDGSVVALMERSLDEAEEERANRVVVRRRRKGSRRNVKRRRGGGRRRRRGGNRRRRGSRRTNVRVYNVAGNRRRGGRRGNRPVVIQG